MDDQEFIADVNDLSTLICAACVGSTKSVVVSALALVTAHACLVGCAETEAHEDAEKVYAAIQEDIGKLAEVRNAAKPRLH